MITKKLELILTTEEIESPEDIEIKLRITSEDDPEEEVVYTITYPKS